MAKKEEVKESLSRYIVFFFYPEDDEIFGVNLGFDNLSDAQLSLNQAERLGGIYDRQENRIVQLKES